MQQNIKSGTIFDCLKSKEGSDEESRHPEEDLQGEVPEYKDLIFIHAVKHKGNLLDSLHVDPNKYKRLSLSEQALVEACQEHGQQIVRYKYNTL